MTPLQKARRGFQIALQKAAQDIFFENPATTFQLDGEDAEFCDEDENVEVDCQFPTPGCTNQSPLQPELNLTGIILLYFLLSSYSHFTKPFPIMYLIQSL